jgi:hypothetical protein
MTEHEPQKGDGGDQVENQTDPLQAVPHRMNGGYRRCGIFDCLVFHFPTLLPGITGKELCSTIRHARTIPGAISIRWHVLMGQEGRVWLCGYKMTASGRSARFRTATTGRASEKLGFDQHTDMVGWVIGIEAPARALQWRGQRAQSLPPAHPNQILLRAMRPRAITSAWISLVPSPIIIRGASR